VLVDCLADCVATIYHCLVVSHIEDKQVLLVSQHLSNRKRTLLADLTVRQMHIGHRFVVSNALGKEFGAFRTYLVVV
jgi:hypothetical protein